MSSSLSKIKCEALIFDQGNTLIMDPFLTVMKLQKKRFTQLCASQGLSINTAQLVHQWARSNAEVNYPHAGHFYQEEPMVQEALRNLGVAEEVAVVLALDLLKEYRIGLGKVIRADPRTTEVRDTLETLRTMHKRLGVFSNDRAVALGFVLNTMRVKHLFEWVETSESFGVEKPDPRVFEHALDYFKLSPSMIIYVGDDPVRDIDAARGKGLKAIQYRVDVRVFQMPWRNYKAKGRHVADAVIDKFSDLLGVVE